MNEEYIYWLWIARTLKPGAKIADIINYFGSPRLLYEKGDREWRISGILSGRQIQELSRVSPSECGDVIRICRENGWRIVTPDSEYYPKRLLDLPDYPAVLFVWGDETVLKNEVMISIVGTRHATDYSVRVTELLSEKLALSGATIISGGALGVDSASHWGAIKAKGKTVAVLGCGLGTDYLRDNEALRREVSHNGAVISEFFPFASASRTTFPMRNRIISGMSLGTVVIEAGEKSGSLITARLALEQGRDVFAVPGDVITSAYTGTNRLIHDGAKPVFTALDILEEYYYTYRSEINLENTDLPLGSFVKGQPVSAKTAEEKPEKPNLPKKELPREEKPQKRNLPENLSENAKKVYNCLGDEPVHIDDISEKSGFNSSQSLAALTELELYSLVTLTQGKKYYKL